MPRILKVYGDRSHYRQPDRYQLIDILKSLWNDRSPEQRRTVYGAWVDSFQSVDAIQAADLVLLPMQWDYYVERGWVALARAAVAAGQAAGKPVAIFGGGDYPANVPFEKVILFETSGYRSRRGRRGSQVFASVPSLQGDYLADHCDGQLRLREKGPRPVVGFCGQAGGTALDLAYRQARNWAQRAVYSLGLCRWEPPPLETTRFRKSVLDRLERSPLVQANFIRRSRYRAGLKPAQTRDAFHASRVEFVRNLLESDYAVCMRGGGNFSVRFYEAMCLGRIPVFVDTDCILPFDHLIDYRRYCVWVNSEEIPQIGEKVADFHAALSPGEFKDLQVECRRLWSDRLRIDSFYQHFADHFDFSP